MADSKLLADFDLLIEALDRVPHSNQAPIAANNWRAGEAFLDGLEPYVNQVLGNLFKDRCTFEFLLDRGYRDTPWLYELDVASRTRECIRHFVEAESGAALGGGADYSFDEKYQQKMIRL